MTDFIKILNAIYQKKNIPTQIMDEYNPYRINKILSQNVDHILSVNEMNLRSNCDNKLQFDYLRHKLKKKPQNTLKWKSQELFGDIDLVKEYYGYSTSKAKSVLKILDDEKLKDIKKRLFKGGISSR